MSMLIRLRRTHALLGGLVAACCAMFAFASLSAAQRPGLRSNPAAGGAGPIVGLIAGTAQWQDPSMASRLDQVLSTSDAKWLREAFYWQRIEPQPGKFTFAHYDHFVLLAARHHVQVMAQLYMAPRWAAKAPTAVPADPTAYAAYVAAVVARYGPGGTFWTAHPNLADYAVQTFELWNEAYYSNGNDGDYNPGRYARLVKAATTAGRAANPAAKFLIGAEMESQLVHSRWVWWVDALYQAVPDLNNYFDGVSVHPYGHDITGRAPAIVGRPYYGYDQMRRIELIRKQFVNHGAADKPFWATEVGWPTCTHGTIRCVSLAGQLKSLNTLMRYSRTIWRSYVRAVFVFYFDDVAPNRADPDNDYGLIFFNHRPKPALGAFRAFARRSPLSVGWP
jgi:hypothetical protein